MTNILIPLFILTFIVSAIYFAFAVDKKSNTSTKKRCQQEEKKEVLSRKQICSKCKTGKYTYELDPRSESCPYIGCWRKNKCPFYKPLDRASKQKTTKKI